MACWCNGNCPHIAPAKALAEAGKHFRAHAELRRILTHAPFCVEANLGIATILTRNNRAEAAGVHLDRAAKSGDGPRVKFERANMYRAQSRMPEAMSEFFGALELDSNNPATAAGLIGVLEMADKLDQAAAVAGEAVKTHPQNEHIRRQSAVVKIAQKDFSGALEVLAGEQISAIEYLDRGRAKEKLGDYAGAWADWMKGRELFRGDRHRQIYDAARFAKNFAALKHAADPPRPAFYPKAGPLPYKPAPLFVTGFPRSGTTIMEQVLSGHSAIAAGDELIALNTCVEALPTWCRVRMSYPAALMALTLGENALVPELLRDLYYGTARARIGFKTAPAKGRGKPSYFTDKMPMNELHLPLIRVLFPSAPVVYMRRHPLDVMVSCMSHWLPHGGFYASTLESCATHYAGVDSVVEHYKKVAPAIAGGAASNFHLIRYEDFVADPEGYARIILAAIGLEFQPACIASHKNKRHARTLSYRQVREPINPDSIGRWKNYRAHLGPAIEILRPILEREGYEH